MANSQEFYSRIDQWFLALRMVYQCHRCSAYQWALVFRNLIHGFLCTWKHTHTMANSIGRSKNTRPMAVVKSQMGTGIPNNDWFTLHLKRSQSGNTLHQSKDRKGKNELLFNPLVLHSSQPIFIDHCNRRSLNFNQTFLLEVTQCSNHRLCGCSHHCCQIIS